jgi:hypothetical protein
VREGVCGIGGMWNKASEVIGHKNSMTTPNEGFGRKITLRFSLSTLLLLVVIVGLTIALVQAHLQLRELRRELGAHEPLRVDEVARQFESQLSTPPVTVRADDVRYSPKEDSYYVKYSFVNSTNPTQRSESGVTLRGDGYGRYRGDVPSLAVPGPLMAVVVETPSALNH